MSPRWHPANWRIPPAACLIPSCNLSRAFREVVAFEPVQAHRECFVRNVEATNVTLHPCALGMLEGSVSIRTEPTSTGDSWVKGEGDIPMRTLDSFNLENVDFIKIDCEGYEENVLRGAMDTIRRCRPVVLVEQKREREHELRHVQERAAAMTSSSSSVTCFRNASSPPPSGITRCAVSAISLVPMAQTCRSCTRATPGRVAARMAKSGGSQAWSAAPLEPALAALPQVARRDLEAALESWGVPRTTG